MGRANMAFTGIPSFGRAPLADLEADWQANVGVLGVPFDEGTGFRPGARFGPRGIREMSMRFPFFDPDSGRTGFYDPDAGARFLEGVTAVDCGDVDVIYLDYTRNFDLTEKAVRDLRRHGALPVVLGGDHSITYPILKAFDDQESLTVVHFDAHLDYRDSFHGVTLAHGSPIRRCAELGHVGRIVSLGIRGLRVVETDLRDAVGFKSQVITCEEYRTKGVPHFREVLHGCPAATRGTRPCYVTIDIDVVNPGSCPGTGTPEPDGLEVRDLVELLAVVAREFRVVGLDLVEVNPTIDPTGITALSAAQVLMQFLGRIFSRR